MKRVRKSVGTDCLKQTIVYSIIWCVVFAQVAPITFGGPEGAQVVNGQVSFQQNGYNTTITASDQSIINYSSFDIGLPETVQFIQPSSSASVLNRILSARPTMIEGTLLANGRVFFVNPAGVIIGGSATINVSQLIASGLNITDESFLSGQYEFVGGDGVVINYGDISADSVCLIGKQVTNIGNISCPDGYVLMAAGERVFLGEPGSNVIVEIGTMQPPDDGTVPSVPEITNEGIVEAEGGTIILAAAGDALARPIIQNSGTLSTSSSSGRGGTITASASEVINTGTVDASGTEGGSIELEGSRVGQFGDVHADGTEGHGGSINLTAEEVVALGSDSLTTANAGANGDGGDVIVYSPDTALFADSAKMEAKGGSESGNGGFVELSGKQYVEIFGDVDTSAPMGNAGMFLIDPYDIEIVAGSGWQRGSWSGSPSDTWTSNNSSGSRLGVDSLLANLLSSDITVLTGGKSSSLDNITVQTPIDYSNPIYNDLTLSAEDHIIVNYQITTGAHDLTLIANNIGSLGDVMINAPIVLGSGELTASGINFASNSSGSITSQGGDVELSFNRNITTNAAINLNGGHLDMLGGRISGASTVQINSNITAGSMTIEAGNPSIGNSGTVNLNVGDGVALTATTGDLIASAREHATIGGDVEAQQGSVYLTGDSDNLGVGRLEIENVSADDNVELAGKNITAAGDIVALKGDITLGNDTDMTKSGAIIQAGDDVKLEPGCHVLTGTGMLTIDAQGGEIDQGTATITVSGSDLIYKQSYDLDMDIRSFGNKGGTIVTLQSYDGYVRDTAANEWQSVSATGNNGDNNSGLAVQLEGPGDITIREVLAENDSVRIQTTGGGNVIFDSITAAETITINSAGAILENPDGTVDLKATDLVLDAVDGIGAPGQAIETDADTLDASVSGTGSIDILEWDQINLLDVDTADGDIRIFGGGQMTATDVIANGEGDVVLATLSGDVVVNYVEADGDQITINSAGAILENPDGTVDLKATDLVLDAVDGIGAPGQAIETDADTLDASVSGTGSIDILEWDQINLLDVDTADGDIRIFGGGQMTATDVIAGGSGEVVLATLSGDVLVDYVEATDDMITISSAGSVQENPDGAVDLKAADLVLDAVDGIGAPGQAIETDADTLDASVSGTGSIDILEWDQINLLDVDTADGDIRIFGGGQMTATDVIANGEGDVVLATLSGDVVVNYVEADGDQITINSAGAILENPDGTVDLKATDLVLDAVDGIGAPGQAIETDADTLDASVSGTGAIDILEWDQINLLDVDTFDGDIRIFSGGQMTATDVIAGGSGEVVLATLSGDVLVDYVEATDDMITISSAGSVQENPDDDADIIAGTLVIDAVTGVGSADALETDVDFIDIDNTTSGDIRIDEVAAGGSLGIIKVAQGGPGQVVIRTLDGTLTVVAGQSGVSATSGAITLAAQDAGTSGDDDLVVDDTVTSTSGKINLDAADDVIFGADGDVTSTSGEIEVDAADAVDMSDGTVLNAGSGKIDIDAAGDITLGSVQTTSSASDAVVIYTSGGAVIDGGETDIDIVANSGTAEIESATGIGTIADPLETQVKTLKAETTAQGDIAIDESDGIILEDITTADGEVQVTAGGTVTATLVDTSVTSDGDNDISITANSGDIEVDRLNAGSDDVTLKATSGAITSVDADDDTVDITAGSFIVLAATGVGAAGSALDLDATTSNITASGDVFFDVVGTGGHSTTIDLSTGNIEIDGRNTAGNGGYEAITLANVDTDDGTVKVYNYDNSITATLLDNSVTDKDVLLKTENSGDIIVDEIISNAAAEVVLASAGSVQENPDDDADIIAGTLVIDAVTGVGSADALETQVDFIDIDNTTSGDIRIDEVAAGGSLGIIKVAQGGPGQVVIRTLDGTLTVVAGQSGVSATSGAITLAAQDAGTSGDDDLVVDDTVTSTSGKINLDAADDVIFGADGDVTSTSGEIEVDAADAVDMSDGTVLNAGSGKIDIDAAGDITLGSVQTTSSASDAVVIYTSGGAVIDGGETDIDIVANSGTAEIESATGIGTIADPLETQVKTLKAETTAQGDIAIDESDGIILEDITTADGEVQVTAGAGDITIGVISGAGGAGDVSLEATTGAINDAADDTLTDITCDELTLKAQDEIGGNPPAGKTVDTLGAIETDVSSLEAESTGNGDIVIVEKDDVDLKNIVAASGSIFLEATGGGMTHVSGTIEAGASTLTLIQKDGLDLAGFNFGNQAGTDLMVKVTEGSFTADSANPGNAADEWQSIQARAYDNIILEGDGDIKIGRHDGYDLTNHPFGGVVISDHGGVSIISNGGTVHTAGDTILDNVVISGYSDAMSNTGVVLPDDPSSEDDSSPGEAAIVIIGSDALRLGPGASIEARGQYYTGIDPTVDDRLSSDFLAAPEGDKNPGDPIDIAIFIASRGDNVNMGSPVTIAPRGAMVIDAFEAVEPFGAGFEASLGGVDWLEACSRVTPTLGYAQTNDTLPYADDLTSFPGPGTYVLRGEGGEDPGTGPGAWVLDDEEGEPVIPLQGLVQASSVEAPTSPDVGDGGPTIEGGGFDDVQWLAEELGLCEGDQKGEDDSLCQEIAQAYLAGAYLQSTDLQPYRAATRLRDLVRILHDDDGTRVGALGRVINEFTRPEMPPSPEQFAVIAETFAEHGRDGTHYATAGQWLDALAEYVEVLSTDIGWSQEESIAFVMGKYGAGITEAGQVNVMAFVQMHLMGIGG